MATDASPSPSPWKPPEIGHEPIANGHGPVYADLQAFGRDTSRFPVPRQRLWLHVLLLLLTGVTTTFVGSLHYTGFLGDFQSSSDLAQAPFVTGLWYSLSILAILGTHEMGHYLACRYYGVRASLPYFLPAPALTGTLGAFIRIRSPIRTKPELFDIGIAGPLAGFIVAVPLLFIGLRLSRVVPLPADPSDLMSLGEPLLFQGASWLVWGTVPDGYSINMHPMAFAAWFGLLATALNLFPMGQLDGGHIAYAVLGRRSTFLTLGTIAGAIVLTFISISWFVWTVLMVVMIFVFGPRHPRTLDEHEPLDPVRKIFAIIAVVIFVISFTPSPIEPFG